MSVHGIKHYLTHTHAHLGMYPHKELHAYNIAGTGGGGLGTVESNTLEQWKITAIHCIFLVS